MYIISSVASCSPHPYLGVEHAVVGASGQQDAPSGICELAVVYLLLMLLVKGPVQHPTLGIPELGQKHADDGPS